MFKAYAHNAAPYRPIIGGHFRAMVQRQPKFELRPEVEKLRVKVPRRDVFPAGHVLGQGLGNLSALFHLRTGRQSRPRQSGKLGTCGAPASGFPLPGQ